MRERFVLSQEGIGLLSVWSSIENAQTAASNYLALHPSAILIISPQWSNRPTDD